MCALRADGGVHSHTLGLVRIADRSHPHFHLCYNVAVWQNRTMATETLNPLQPSGYYMYRQFNIQQFYVPPTQCIYVFCIDLRKNRDYFPIQHSFTGLYNRDLTLYSPVVIMHISSLTFNNSTFCPHSAFVCFVWISEQTEINFPTQH